MRNLFSIFLFLFISFSLFSQTIIPKPNPAQNNSLTQFKSDEILVVFNEETDESEIHEFLFEHGLYILEGPTPNLGCYRLGMNNPPPATYSTNPQDTINGIVKESVQDVKVDGAGLNYVVDKDNYSSTKVSSTFGSNKRYCYDLFGRESSGNSKVLTSIFDTGIIMDESYWGNYYDPKKLGYNYIEDDQPVDKHGHGTHLSSIITKNLPNDQEQITLYAYKTQNAEGVGSVFDAIQALDQAITDQINVVNMSFSYNTYPGEAFKPKQVFSYCINQAAVLGDILVVASAGNGAHDNDAVTGNQTLSKDVITLPSSFPLNNIISVASASCKKEISRFSNYGATRVDVFAPGEDIFGYDHNGQAVLWSGTSQSAAFVTKLATFLGTYQSTFDWEEVKCAIMSGVESSPDGDLVLSRGYINVLNSLEIIKNNECSQQGYIAPTIDENTLNVIVDQDASVLSISSQKNQTCILQIVDPMGRVIEKLDLQLDKGNNNIDLSILNSQLNGIYFMNIRGEGLNKTLKLFRSI